MKQQHQEKNIPFTIPNQNNQIQPNNDQLYRAESSNQENFKDRMITKMNSVIEATANFFECIRLFMPEKLEQVKKNSISPSSAEHQNQSAKSDQVAQDLNNISKLSTRQDLKASDKSIRDEDYRQLPVKSYSMNQPLKLIKRYAQTYELSYSQRESKFPYTFQQVLKVRQNQQNLKSKTFWQQFKRLIFCRGGNYIDELQQQTDARSDTNSRILMGKDKQLNLASKSHQDNIFLIDQSNREQNQMEQIKLNRNVNIGKRSYKNINQIGQQKVYSTENEFRQQQKIERRKRKSLDIKGTTNYAYQDNIFKIEGVLNINQQIGEQDDIPMQSAANKNSNINISNAHNLDNSNNNSNMNIEVNNNNQNANNNTNNITNSDNNQNRVEQNIQNVVDYSMEYQIKLNEQPAEQSKEKAPRRKKNKRQQSRAVVIKENDINEDVIEIQQL